MNNYESIILIAEKVEENKRNEVLEKIKNLIKENGEITDVIDAGLRKLAYKVRKNENAYFYELYFKTKPEIIVELERLYRITDEIIKYITFKDVKK